MPVLILYFPVPSKFRFMYIDVSFVFLISEDILERDFWFARFSRIFTAFAWASRFSAFAIEITVSLIFKNPSDEAV